MNKVWSWFFVVAWMMVIFYLSHQPAAESSRLSLGVTDWLLNVVALMIPEELFSVERFHFFIRKAAHFIAYFILGALVLRALASSGVRGWKTVSFAFLLSFVYAISDELHQYFVPGRAAQVRDVLIDSLGACCGILLARGLGKLQKRLESRDVYGE